MRRILIGDLHGNHVGLNWLLEEVDYTPKDTLIFLGDYNDHFPHIGCSTKILVDKLLELQNKNTHFLLGNHDKWFRDYMLRGDKADIWMVQGGEETLNSYIPTGIISGDHIDFYEKLLPYYMDDVVLAVHAGLPPSGSEEFFYTCHQIRSGGIPENISPLLWDREFIFSPWDEDYYAFKSAFGDRYFVTGHTAHLGPFQNPQFEKWYMIDTDFRGNNLCALVIDDGAKIIKYTFN